jgi:antitoxin component YwqK of YwqJK toxin-antitoxin module
MRGLRLAAAVPALSVLASVLLVGCEPQTPPAPSLPAPAQDPAPTPTPLGGGAGSTTPVGASDVGAPRPIELPAGLVKPDDRGAQGGGQPAKEAEGAPAKGAAAEDWPGTELREEFHPDGSPRLSRRVRKTEDGIENHGPFRRWAPNGVVTEEGIYRGGEKDGLYTLRHESGIPSVEAHYKLGVLDGLRREWSDVATLTYEATFVAGKVEGEERTWWPDGTKKSLATFRNGVLQGPSGVWHGNGVQAEQGQSVAGQREGTWTYRLPDETVKLVEQYHAGKLHGVTREFDDAGKLSAEREYVDGKASGMHREFWPNGKPRSETMYAGGKPEGPSSRWYENGQKESEGAHVAGQREGLWTCWREDGSLDTAASGTYHAGQRVKDK